MRTLDLETLTLTMGSHENAADGFCVMEAVAYIAGEPWSDHPLCVSPIIIALLRAYNDQVGDQIRQSIKQYIPRLIGTKGSYALEQRRSLIAADWLLRVRAPAWLRVAGLVDHADTLASLPELIALSHIPSIQPVIDDALRGAKGAVQARPNVPALIAVRAAIMAASGASGRPAASSAASSAAWNTVRVEGVEVWGDVFNISLYAAMAAALAGVTLQPTVYELQATIPALIERMLSASE